MQSRTIPIPDGLEGTRVDAGVSKLLGLSRTQVADIAAAGGITIDGKLVGKSDRMTAGAVISVEWEQAGPVEVVPIAVPDLKIVHDEDDFVVIDKPVGVAAHPSIGWDGPTVLGALAAAGFTISTSGQSERQGIVHRLDAGTSGLMVVAKSELAYAQLKKAFHDRQVEKVYHAVVQGHPDPLSGTIDAPIGRHPGSSWKFAVTSEGKPSVTHYETLEAFRRGALLEVHLETGRTHQIRVHMAAQRHPCVGDPLYGSDPTLAGKLGLRRQWLHAKELGFAHPRTGEPVRFTTEYPDDLAHSLELLREGEL
ncbi:MULTISPECIES: RluA family pseudouridine synthase [unclassified Pseudoclavibacter]|jgi:23S rRNA pseudouridine1911/1915/1917 synthase|uniref:RluA family pseudouridine synthase n=1 Tax=unclassified Pseudoclavibacter TaxID=2615177 RepID=UPI000CE7604D|nr:MULTISPECIES: RluA family pseudouridine synthase [unclassified Pseudoclavibacter]NYF13800.1 23S rRNA pseudouridine1911/1915/1917 synthase [Pseudoclavibacter sp. JAI123]PPG29250.1 RNA pseudouridine synthase [Pseudoclavibacter sp. RFBB5]